MNNTQRGFGFLHILAIILVIGLGAAYWKYTSKQEAGRAAFVAAEEADKRRKSDEEADRKLKAEIERKEFEARAEAEMRKSEFAKSFQLLDGLRLRWVDAFKIASVTARISLAQPVANLQSIRRETVALMVPSCLVSAKGSLVSGMDMSIEGFMAFMGNSSNGEIVAKPYFSGAEKAFKEYVEKANDCKFLVSAPPR